MDLKYLYESLDGLMAYDLGATDSGIHDEKLKEEVKEYLHALDENEFRVIITSFVREYFVSEKAVEKGYGIEDVKSFMEWLDTSMDIYL
jgi:KaiC/GvpD/RAD55 family RecA-like ATPase